MGLMATIGRTNGEMGQRAAGVSERYLILFVTKAKTDHSSPGGLGWPVLDI